MNAIVVDKLKKTFSKPLRDPGLLGFFKGLVSRRMVHMDAVKEVSFTIKKGEFVGFVGPNGAGKTTTLKMLGGILYPTTGTATVLGHTPWKREKAFQKQFSLVMGQKNQLWWDLPVRESFEFNRVVYEIPTNIFKEQSKRLIDLLGIEKLLDTQVRKLSLGERMKCELAAALLHKPSILFLDEPTIGLDVISQKNIRDFLHTYNKEEGATIILTSHYMEDIRRLCDRVIIIDHGRLIYDGAYHDLVEQYADTKTIEILFKEPVSAERFIGLGKIADVRDIFVRLMVPRHDVTKIVNKLLTEFPVDDISIHEESMEEIVSDIFTRSDSTI
ncbi:ATP-binding cassette domain-containing protein [Candidatus Gracilibacteria bacterium]|nr:ATP-binding cassette domain-containing protein [Candidatus Gracilibacteria bacterium]